MQLANSLPVDTDLITVAEAAAKYAIDPRRLRGVLWRENTTGDLDLPIGSFLTDQVYDDERLRAWCAKQRAAH